MKFFSLNLILFLFLTACSMQSRDDGETLNTVQNEGSAVIVFKELSHDFGRIHEGEMVGWYFSYMNQGDNDLIINKAVSSCGCTIPDFESSPLAPGKESKLKVIYDSNGRLGKEIKTVTLYTNAREPVVKLKLIVEVLR